MSGISKLREVGSLCWLLELREVRALCCQRALQMAYAVVRSHRQLAELDRYCMRNICLCDDKQPTRLC
jgi:hypothetical protein